MATQRLHRVVCAGKVGFGESCVDFFVANMVQQSRRAAFATFEFWDQVMQALWDTRWNRAHAKRANWVCDVLVLHGGSLVVIKGGLFAV